MTMSGSKVSRIPQAKARPEKNMENKTHTEEDQISAGLGIGSTVTLDGEKMRGLGGFQPINEPGPPRGR